MRDWSAKELGAINGWEKNVVMTTTITTLKGKLTKGQTGKTNGKKHNMTAKKQKDKRKSKGHKDTRARGKKKERGNEGKRTRGKG